MDFLLSLCSFWCIPRSCAQQRDDDASDAIFLELLGRERKKCRAANAKPIVIHKSSLSFVLHLWSWIFIDWKWSDVIIIRRIIKSLTLIGLKRLFFFVRLPSLVFLISVQCTQAINVNLRQANLSWHFRHITLNESFVALARMALRNWIKPSEQFLNVQTMTLNLFSFRLVFVSALLFHSSWFGGGREVVTPERQKFEIDIFGHNF